jgi:hypothetical protein
MSSERLGARNLLSRHKGTPRVGELVAYKEPDGRIRVGRVTILWDNNGESAFDVVIDRKWRGTGLVKNILKRHMDKIPP